VPEDISQYREVCDKCHGEGYIYDKTSPRKDHEGYDSIQCDKCKGYGVIFICKWCGEVIKNPSHGSILYHQTPRPGYKKSCKDYARQDLNTNKHKPKYRQSLVGSDKKKLGCKDTGLTKPLSPDFNEAEKQVKKEKSRLRIL
jgi:hypothetical protein